MRVTLSGGKLYYFVNGDLVGSGSFTKPTADKFYIKSSGTVYLDELRVTTGSLSSTGTYNPSNAPYDTNKVLALPDKLTANTIYVQHNTPVTDSRIGGVRPSNPAEGFFYIPLHDDNTGGQPQLYTGGNWVNVTAMVYDGSTIKDAKGFKFSPVGSSPDVDMNAKPERPVKPQDPETCTHEWAEYAPDSVAPTCTLAGMKVYLCSKCEKQKTESVPLLDHDSMAVLVLAGLCYLPVFLRSFLCPPHPHVLNVYFGVPGSGKTTFAAHLTRWALHENALIRFCRRHPNFLTRPLLNSRYLKRRIPVYSNVPITGAYQLNPQLDIGKYMIEDAKVIIDEAGIEYNNRNYKAFPQEAIYFYKYHRHYKVSVDVFSQSYEDMDVTLRRLAQNFYVVRRSLVPFCVVARRIRRRVGVDEQTKQIQDLYSMGLPLLDTRRIFSPPLWKLFNSYSRKELPQKEWPVW